jgi:catechol 2,3-dioxygenase-like lactoylglutathione lyase family enzyme
MHPGSRRTGNVTEVVPLLGVSSMERSLRYYVDGLGFTMKNKWVVDGSVRWCWLALGGAALMLQELAKQGPHSPAPHGKLGEGVSLWFQCEDAIAIYHEVASRGIEASEPQVGNAMWETSLSDPDGYRIHFGSPTNTAEETKLSEVKG